MVQAFSQLKGVLDERGMTVPELHRRLEKQGLSVNLKSLYRLVRDDRPLERLNLRVAGLICQVCGVPLSRLIAFEIEDAQLRRLSAAKQLRLDELMDTNNEGRLAPAQRKEFQGLVRETEEIALHNAPGSRVGAGRSLRRREARRMIGTTTLEDACVRRATGPDRVEGRVPLRILPGSPGHLRVPIPHGPYPAHRARRLKLAAEPMPRVCVVQPGQGRQD